MIEFWNALLEPDNQFLRFAVYMSLLAGPAFGVIGSYVVARRISYLAGAISHCAFGGIGAGLYLRQTFGLDWLKSDITVVGSGKLGRAVLLGGV